MAASSAKLPTEVTKKDAALIAPSPTGTAFANFYIALKPHGSTSAFGNAFAATLIITFAAFFQ